MNSTRRIFFLVQDNFRRFISLSYYWTMKNKYIKVTHIAERKTRGIIRLFSLDIEAKKTAELTGSISRQTVNKFYGAFRERIAELCEAESPFENGEVELDESYFGARRVRGIRGRGARGKYPYSACSSGATWSTRKSLEVALCKS
jgi:hypothetical protein